MVSNRQRRSYAECLNRYLEFWVRLFESEEYQNTIRDIGAGMSGSGNGGGSQLSQSPGQGQRIARSIVSGGGGIG